MFSDFLQIRTVYAARGDRHGVSTAAGPGSTCRRLRSRASAGKRSQSGVRACGRGNGRPLLCDFLRAPAADPGRTHASVGPVPGCKRAAPGRIEAFAGPRQDGGFVPAHSLRVEAASERAFTIERRGCPPRLRPTRNVSPEHRAGTRSAAATVLPIPESRNSPCPYASG